MVHILEKWRFNQRRAWEIHVLARTNKTLRTHIVQYDELTPTSDQQSNRTGGEATHQALNSSNMCNQRSTSGSNKMHMTIPADPISCNVSGIFILKYSDKED